MSTIRGLAILDRQHYGKPGRNDRGATYDGLYEADLTPLYIAGMKKALEAAGCAVHLLDSGWYGDRHEEANVIAQAHRNVPVAYAACHVNALNGRGADYAAFLYDGRSKGGEALAVAVSGAVADAGLPGIRRSIVRKATADNDWKNAWHTVDGIFAGPANISGVCLEPFFLDRKEHRWATTPEGGMRLGGVMAQGFLAWMDSRR